MKATNNFLRKCQVAKVTQEVTKKGRRRNCVWMHVVNKTLAKDMEQNMKRIHREKKNLSKECRDGSSLQSSLT